MQRNNISLYYGEVNCADQIDYYHYLKFTSGGQVKEQEVEEGRVLDHDHDDDVADVDEDVNYIPNCLIAQLLIIVISSVKFN